MKKPATAEVLPVVDPVELTKSCTIALLLSKHPVTRDVQDPYTINQTMERLTSVIPVIHPSVPWRASSKITQDDETDTSIAATLERARAQRRAARFQLTVVPVTVAILFMILLLCGLY